MATDQTSDRASISPVCSRSGDEYGMLPNWLNVMLRVIETAFAIPKSSTFTWPADVMRMLRGLISP